MRNPFHSARQITGSDTVADLDVYENCALLQILYSFDRFPVIMAKYQMRYTKKIVYTICSEQRLAQRYLINSAAMDAVSCKINNSP